MVPSSEKTSSKPSLIQATLAFFVSNGLYLIIIFFNFCLLFGSSFITFSTQIGTRALALLFYASIQVLLPLGGFKCHLKDGSPWRSFSEQFFAPGRVLRSYLKLKFGDLPKNFVEAEAKPDAQFILAAFPHGCGSDFRILMEGCIQNIMPNIVKKNNLRTLAASVLFMIPLVREISLWTGCIDANRKTAEKALDRGRSLIIIPGGEAEQLLTTYGKEQVFLKSRKGFIKLAMRKKVPVVPIYVFGSSDMVYTSSFLYGPRKWLMKTFGVCIPLGFGVLGTFCPLPKAITIVFGSPLTFEMKGRDPTDVELNKAHETFCNELKCLFDSHKESLGYGDRELILM